jgi:hypothetical protein
LDLLGLDLLPNLLLAPRRHLELHEAELPRAVRAVDLPVVVVRIVLKRLPAFGAAVLSRAAIVSVRILKDRCATQTTRC